MFSEQVIRELLPYGLNLLDDYSTRYKVMGLKILRKLAKSPSLELNPNLAITLFDQFINATVYQELEIVVILFPLLVEFHELLGKVLSSSELESYTLKFFKVLLDDMDRSCAGAFRKVTNCLFQSLDLVFF